jgi:hypothetical protein
LGTMPYAISVRLRLNACWNRLSILYTVEGGMISSRRCRELTVELVERLDFEKEPSVPLEKASIAQKFHAEAESAIAYLEAEFRPSCRQA